MTTLNTNIIGNDGDHGSSMLAIAQPMLEKAIYDSLFHLKMTENLTEFEMRKVVKTIIMSDWITWGSARCAGKTLLRCQQMTDMGFISVEKRTDMSMGSDILCTRT